MRAPTITGSSVNTGFPSQAPVFLIGFGTYYFLRSAPGTNLTRSPFWSNALFVFCLMAFTSLLFEPPGFIPSFLIGAIILAGLVVAISSQRDPLSGQSDIRLHRHDQLQLLSRPLCRPRCRLAPVRPEHRHSCPRCGQLAAQPDSVRQDYQRDVRPDDYLRDGDISSHREAPALPPDGKSFTGSIARDQPRSTPNRSPRIR